MDRDDWLFVGLLIMSAPIAFGIGLALGLAWVRFLS